MNGSIKIIGSKYVNQEIDTIMTISTKGVPIAQAVAYQLNVPFVIVRKSSKVTEGSTVSINYQPRSSSQEVEKMALSKNSLQPEFDCEVVDGVVFLEHDSQAGTDNYRSLLKIKSVDPKTLEIEVELGNFLTD